MPVGRDEERREVTGTQASVAIFSPFSQMSVLGVLCTQQRMLGSGAESHRHTQVVGVVSMVTFQQHDITSAVTFKLFKAFWISGIT